MLTILWKKKIYKPFQEVCASRHTCTRMCMRISTVVACKKKTASESIFTHPHTCFHKHSSAVFPQFSTCLHQNHLADPHQSCFRGSYSSDAALPGRHSAAASISSLCSCWTVLGALDIANHQIFLSNLKKNCQSQTLHKDGTVMVASGINCSLILFVEFYHGT